MEAVPCTQAHQNGDPHRRVLAQLHRVVVRIEGQGRGRCVHHPAGTKGADLLQGDAVGIVGRHQVVDLDRGGPTLAGKDDLVSH
jgi:hypothetical protein